MSGQGYPGDGWRNPSYLLDRHLARTGGREAALSDPMARVQVAILRDLLALVQAACDDEGLDPAATHRIVERVVYGGTPSRSAAEHEQWMVADAAAALARAEPVLRRFLD